MSILDEAPARSTSALASRWQRTATTLGPASALPPRQQQVLRLFARGVPQKVIAIDLGIAGSTVATHLRKALAGLHIEPQQAAYAVVAASPDEVPPDAGDIALPAHLTAAEVDVVRAILRGASNLDIARRRGRSIRTVANQVASAFRKLGVSSRRELYARAPGWGRQS